MNITLGYWIARNGHRRKVIELDSPADFPIISYLDDGEPCHEVQIAHHLADGRCALTCATDNDLIGPWPYTI